jgi:hypothetical protein
MVRGIILKLKPDFVSFKSGRRIHAPKTFCKMIEESERDAIVV